MLLFLLLFSAIVLVYIYFRGKSNEDYWRMRGVKFHQESKVIGVFGDFLTKDEAVFENLYNIYKKYPNEPAVGLGTFFLPTLYIFDPINVQHVLTTEFNAFNHRGLEVNDNDPLAKGLFFISGTKWKLMRQSLTPLFTSTKLKLMYYIMDKSAQDFVKYLKDEPKLKNGNTFELLSTFCFAAVGGAVFGVTTKSVFDSPFLKLVKNSFRPNPLFNLKFSILHTCNPIFKLLGIKFFNKEDDIFFIDAFKEVIRQREQDKTKKHDFVDIGVSLKSNKVLKDESGLEVEVTDELIAAQAFLFFFAGVDPTALAMYAVLLELGKHLDVLQRIHEEIDDVFEKYNGNITYDVVSSMEYLDMVVNESLRLHPPVGYLTRRCKQDTYLPIGNIKIDKGTKVFIPLFGMHHDEKYFLNAETFDPERFSLENRNNIKEIAFMPFGKGNRNCIGMRYSYYQIKAGLIHLLRNFTVETKMPENGIKYTKDGFSVRINNVNVKLVDRHFKVI